MGCPFFPLLGAYLVLLSTIEVAVVAASWVSLRLTRPLAGIILLAAEAGAWRVWRALRREGADKSLSTVIAEQRWGRVIATAFLVYSIFLFIVAAMVGDPTWDGNTYHLPTIQQWFQQGRVAWIEGLAEVLPFMNGYPKSAEVLSFFMCVLLHPALSNTLNLVFLPLGILGIGSLACALGATRGAALLAGAALLLVPIHIGQSLSTYVDSAFGSAVIAWLAVAVRLRQLDATRFGIQALLLGCALGQVIGIKGTGLPLGAMGSLALIAVQWGRRSAEVSRRTLTAWWFAVVICAAAVGGYWYVRNIAHGHSPLYPIALSVAGFRVFPGIDAYAPAGAYALDGFIAPWPTVAQVAFTWLQGLWHWPRSIVGFDSRLGGLGFLWPLGCLPAIFILVRRRIRARTTWRDELLSHPLWLLLAITSVGFAFLPCPWWSRFSMWIYGLGLPCLAVVLNEERGRRGRTWIAACAAIAILEAGIAVARWQVPLLGVVLRDAPETARRRGPSVRVPTHFYPPWSFHGSIIERLARGHDTIGVGQVAWYQQSIFGVIAEPVGARPIYLLPENPERDFAAWYERIRPRYIIMDEHAEVPAVVAQLRPEVLYSHSFVVLQFW